MKKARITVSLLAFMLIGTMAIPAAASAKRYKFGERTLKVGKRGGDVRTLQRYLDRIGYDTDVDGAFGRGTRSSVKEFEAFQGRRRDGKVTRRDARALRDVARNGGAVLRSSSETGGTSMAHVEIEDDQPLKLGPGMKATVDSKGYAIAPAAAPQVVKDVIEAGNKIAKKPYIYGGGHGKWEDRGYDCSGSVSYALHGGGLLKSSMPSGGFMRWAERGRGDWITIYAKGSHMYMVVAGLRYDTSGRTKNNTRWQADMRSTRGYSVRHPKGL